MKKIKLYTLITISTLLFTSCIVEKYDPSEVEKLLNAGTSPIELYKGGITLEQLYGKSYKGGLIFYVDINNDYDGLEGLVAASNDLESGKTIRWGCEATDIKNLNPVGPPANGNSTGARIGEGVSNTKAIIAACPSSAAKSCKELGSEWFLPSRAELHEMYTNLHLKGHGNFKSKRYWSSTILDAFNAWFEHFDTGERYYDTRPSALNVRAIKAF